MINVTKTYLPKREILDQYIDSVYSSGWLTNNGCLLLSLEEKLKAYLGVEHLLIVSNGTLALQIAYKALGLTGEVITTPFSFVATTSTLAWEGLKPVFADINNHDFNINVDLIADKISSNTSAILPVHVFGAGCDVNALEELSKKHHLKLIFDAAHAFDVRDDQKNILSYGDASIISFHATKIFHTIEGGAIVFKHKEDLEKAKLMINFGISGYDKIDTIGINAKMNEFQAAMGLALLDEMPQVIQWRKEVFERYEAAFLHQKGVQRQQRNIHFSLNYAYYPLVFISEDKLLEVQSELKKADVFARRYFYPSLNTLHYLDSQICPVSESIAKRILCIPIFPGLEIQDQQLIIDIILSKI